MVNWILVWSGIPQGSVPLLFFIFINYSYEHINSNILKFADIQEIQGS